MGLNSPVSILYDANGNLVVTASGSAVPAAAVPVMGSDGTNARFFSVDSSGRTVVTGASAAASAVAGNPVLVGGSDGTNARFLSVDTSGRLNVNIVATGGSNFASAFPSTGTASGFSDGTNMQGARVFDADTGGGTQYVLGAVLRKSASGGSVEAGTSTDPLRTDPTGTTAQPVTDNGGSLTVDGTVTSNQGTAAAATAPWPVRQSDGTAFISPALAAQLPAALVGARLDTNNGAWLGSTAPTVGQKAMASSVPVAISSDQAAFPVNQGTAAALSGRWPVIVTDGTNTMPTMDTVARSAFHRITDGTNTAAVKPATTAPVAADQALVVVLSPNQPAIPVTSAPSQSAPGIAFGDPTYASTARQPVRRTAYTEPVANFQGSIVSSSAADASAGTGARTVRVYYVDVTGVTAGTEDVTLNGTTNVNLVTTTKCFIEKMEVLTAGSGAVAAGTITLRTGLAGGGNVVGTIAAGDTITFWAHHYVVTGKTCNITGTLIGSNSTVAGNGSVFMIVTRPLNTSNPVERQISDFMTLFGQSSQVNRNYTSYIRVAGPARIIMYVTPVSGTSNTYRGSFDYYDE